MVSDAFSLQALGFGLVLVAFLAYGAFLLSRHRSGWSRHPAVWLYAAALLLSAAWALAELVDPLSSKLITAYLARALDQLRYAAWCWFLLALLAPRGTAAGDPGRGAAPPTPRSWLSLAPAVLLAAGAVATLRLDLSGGADAAPERSLALLQLAWAVLCLLLLEQLFRNQADETRWGAKPLCLGLGAMAAFDIYLYSQAMMFGAADPDAQAARGLAHAMTVPLLWAASQRQAQWLNRIQVSRGAAFYSATLLLIGLYLLFIAAVGYYVRFFGGNWGGALQVALLFAAAIALLVLLASGSSRARLRVFVGKHFFSYRYDYRREWLRFTAMLAASNSPQELGGLVVRGLADMAESPAGCLWFKALGDDGFVQSARWNMPASGAVEPLDSPFCRFMAQHEWIVDLSRDTGPGRAVAAAGLPEPPLWLRDLESAWLVVPLMVADQLTGFVVLARPRTALEANWEVRDLLKTAARQAAGFLAQLHTAEALLEARKFDAFNRMSAFVVHDLKNIITQLSLMLKNAERHRDNPEFQADMVLTIESSLDKMRQMMLQLREGNKPVGGASGVELVPILQRIGRHAAQRGRSLDIERADRLATRGDAERLERVIGHVVQNALDATPPTGRVWASLRQAAGRAELVVGDTGEGMSPEFIQNRLFRPFSSTKASGMGIGSYESFQYVRELGGSIDVKSELGSGTVITILLPLFDLRTGSDLKPGIAA